MKYTINEIENIVTAAIDRLGNDATAVEKHKMKNSVGAYTFGGWDFEFISYEALVDDFFDWFIN